MNRTNTTTQGTIFDRFIEKGLVRKQLHLLATQPDRFVRNKAYEKLIEVAVSWASDQLDQMADAARRGCFMMEFQARLAATGYVSQVGELYISAAKTALAARAMARPRSAAKLAVVVG